jgi:hypothetical protein
MLYSFIPLSMKVNYERCISGSDRHGSPGTYPRFKFAVPKALFVAQIGSHGIEITVVRVVLSSTLKHQERLGI